MNEADGFRIEAAQQFGFQTTDDDAENYACTEAQLIAFAKACERKGRAEIGKYIREGEKNLTVQAEAAERKGDVGQALMVGLIAGAMQEVGDEIDRRNDAADAELLPLLEAERRRFLESQGYVRQADGQWVKAESTQ